MQLLLPSDVVRKMRKHMFRAGRREIGGMIMGEQIADQQFRIVEFSVDATSGTRSNFVRAMLKSGNKQCSSKPMERSHRSSSPAA